MKILNRVILFFSIFIFAGINNQDNASATRDLQTEKLLHDAGEMFYGGNYGAAMKKIRSSLHENTDPAVITSLFLNLAEVFIITGKPDSSLKYLNLASAEILDHPETEPALIYEYYFLKGRICNFQRKFKQARDNFDVALQQLGRMKSEVPENYAGIFKETAYSYFWQMEPDSAEKYFTKALGYSSKYPAPEEKIIEIQAGLLKLYLETCENEKASVLLDACEHYIDSVKGPLQPILFDACILVGDYYYNIEMKPELTMRFFGKAAEILKTYFDDDYYKYAVLFYSYGKTEADRLSYDRAVTYFEQALGFADSCPALFEYRFLINRWLATIYQREKNAERTIHYCRYCIDHSDSTYSSLSYTYLTLSRAMKMLSDTSAALTCLHQGFEQASARMIRDNFRMKADILYETGLTWLELHDTVNAFSYLDEARKELEEISYRGTLVSTVHIYLGRLYRMKQDYVNAIRESHKAMIAACNVFSDTSILSDAGIKDTYLYYPLLAANYWKAENLVSLYRSNPSETGLLEKSNVFYRNEVDLLEKMISGMPSQSDAFARIDETYGYIDKVIDNSYECYTATGNAYYAEKAFEYTEKSRILAMRMYLLNGDEMNFADVPASVLKKEEEIRGRISEIEYQLAATREMMPWQVTDTLESRLARLYLEYNDFTGFLDRHYSKYYSLNYPGGITAKKLRNATGSRHVFLEYQVTGSFLYIFLFSGKDFKIFRQPLPGDLWEKINTVRSCIVDNPFVYDTGNGLDKFTDASHFLYKVLIAPAEKYIEGKRLVISPYEKMASIPFEVLVKELPAQKATNFSQPDYLCRHNVITYMFSGAMTGIKRKSGHLFNRTAIFLPDNAPDGGTELLPLLHGAQKEAAEVNLLIRGHLYSGAPACESDFKKLAPRYDIIHIASHSITDTVKYYLSAIPLTPSNNGSEDDYLHVYEILQLKLKAKLVVLSGCNTGFGRIRTIAGMQSIATAFFYAGVRTMAYTLWQLADRQSAMLVADFYAGLKKLKSPGRAMNDARLKTLGTGDPVTSHPFFWAAYVVNGNDRPLMIPEMLIKYAVLVLMLISVNIRLNFTFTGRH